MRTNKKDYLIVDGYNIINAWDELKSGAYKTGDDEKNIIIVILAILLASSVSQSMIDEAQSNCIDRCVRLDDLPYRTCKRDCRWDSGSH